VSVWIIFQRQIEALNNLEMMLDSAVGNVDAVTRGRCRAEHQKLTNRQRILQQRAAERLPALTSQVNSAGDMWRRFNKQWSSACAVLDEVDGKLPECVDITCDVPVLRQQLTDCQQASDKLQSEMPRISNVIELGERLLEHVNSPHVRSQVDDLSDRLHCCTQKTDSSLQRYFSVLLT